MKLGTFALALGSINEEVYLIRPFGSKIGALISDIYKNLKNVKKVVSLISHIFSE